MNFIFSAHFLLVSSWSEMTSARFIVFVIFCSPITLPFCLSPRRCRIFPSSFSRFVNLLLRRFVLRSSYEDNRNFKPLKEGRQIILLSFGFQWKFKFSCYYCWSFFSTQNYVVPISGAHFWLFIIKEVQSLHSGQTVKNISNWAKILQNS